MTPAERIEKAIEIMQKHGRENDIASVEEDHGRLIKALECALENMKNRSDDIATKEDIADFLEGKK